MINQCVAEWCFLKKGQDPQAYYARLRELGYQGVEMVDPARWKLARAAGLEIVSLSAPGMTLPGLNHRDEHGELLPRIREAIATAGANGIGAVIVFSGNRRGLSDEEGVAACVAGLEQLVGDAERAGVTLWFEALNGFEHVDYHADRSAFAFRVIDRVASPRLEVLYDLYHMRRMGEPLERDILANLGRIGHFHIAGSPHHGFPGQDQEIDFRAIVAAVHRAGYRGWWGQEFLPGADVFGELERAQRLFAGYADGAAAARG